MLNICFSEGAYSSLKFAVEDGYLIPSETICLPDDLSLGDISNVRNFETRRKVLNALFRNENYVKDNCSRYYREFFDQIYNHDHIKIWYANTPTEFCGLLYTIWVLRQLPVEIELICCSRTLKRGDNQYVSYDTAAEIRPEELIRFLPFTEHLDNQIKREYALEWEKLMEENGSLRVYWNHNIQTADPGYYDSVLLKYASYTPKKVADMIGEFVSTERLGVHDSFIAFRIRSLLEEGRLRYIEKDNHFYQSYLCLNAEEKEGRILSIEPERKRFEI